MTAYHDRLEAGEYAPKKDKPKKTKTAGEDKTPTTEQTAKPSA